MATGSRRMLKAKRRTNKKRQTRKRKGGRRKGSKKERFSLKQKRAAKARAEKREKKAWKSESLSKEGGRDRRQLNIDGTSGAYYYSDYCYDYDGNACTFKEMYDPRICTDENPNAATMCVNGVPHTGEMCLDSMIEAYPAMKLYAQLKDLCPYTDSTGT